MPIGGNADTFTITGAKLKVSGDVEVSGSIVYTTDATGFGGVTAQIDGNNTLNITAGKTSGVAKIERGTTATINAITHTNVSNNTTIHIALKNTSSIKGDFVTIETFEEDDTVKVNYTDEYVIGPGETGMLTLRKVNGVLSLFIREMFSSTATDTDTKPFYIKDGTNYKYPLYKSTGENLTITPVPINGVSYYQPSGGYTTKTRPPLGIPELIVTPSGNLAIGNNAAGTTVNYDVWGVPSSFDFGSIYQGTTKKTSFLLENGEASGSFTESGASSGDTYSLYVDKTDTSTSDTISLGGFTGTIAFHHDTFANSGDPYGDGTLAGATANAHVFTDTQTGTYDWGTLTGNTLTSTETTYTWTPPSEITGADVLMVAGGGGGGKQVGGGGGAGGLLHHTNKSLSGQKTIVVGNGGIGGDYGNGTTAYSGNNTSFTGFDNDAIGGGAGASYNGIAGSTGGSGGGGGGGATTGQTGTSDQGNSGGQGRDSNWAGGGGGGAGAAGQGSPSNDTGGAGGAGLDKSSVFGTTYGVSGWFAGGGGGASNGTTTAGAGGQGGGGNGGNNNSGTANMRQAGTKHTGGGGGGSRDGTSGTPTSLDPYGYETGDGGNGGSGIVLIKSPGTGKIIPKITGISNVTSTGSKTINYTFNTQGTGIDKVTYKIGSGSEVTTASGVYTLAYTPADFGTTTMTHAYAVDSSGNQLGTKFGPYSVTTKLSGLGHISPAILLFLNMGTTVTDSVNSVAFTTDSGSFTYDTTNNAITNSSSARMKLDFTSVRTDRATAISAFYEFYLPNNTDYGYAASLGGVHNTTGNNNDAIGWYGHDSTTPITHYWGNGTQALPTQYNYSNYYGKWVKLGWVREASGNNFKVYVDGVYVHTHTPTDGSLTGTGVLSYFYLFRHAARGNENQYTTDDAISFRNLEIYQASFTDAQILAAYGS